MRNFLEQKCPKYFNVNDDKNTHYMCCKNRSGVGATHIQSTRTAHANPTYLPTLGSWGVRQPRVSTAQRALLAGVASTASAQPLWRQALAGAGRHRRHTGQVCSHDASPVGF